MSRIYPVPKHINTILLVKTAIMLVIKEPKQSNQNKVKKKKDNTS
jgi:hypothetical protein